MPYMIVQYVICIKAKAVYIPYIFCNGVAWLFTFSVKNLDSLQKILFFVRELQKMLNMARKLQRKPLLSYTENVCVIAKQSIKKQ